MKINLDHHMSIFGRSLSLSKEKSLHIDEDFRRSRIGLNRHISTSDVEY